MAAKGKKCQDIKSTDWIISSFSDSFGPLQNDGVDVSDEDLCSPVEKKGKFDDNGRGLNCNTYSGSLPKEDRHKRSDSKLLNCKVWTDKFKPKVVDELVVHKKKVVEVSEYLNNVFSVSNCGKILLLTGPTGCGKTCTLNVLCKHLNINITEWVTPIDSVLNYYELGDIFETFPDSRTFNSRSKKLTVNSFNEFIVQATKYSSLLSANNGCNNKKLVLIKDFPNILIEESDIFHEIITKYNLNSTTVTDLSPLVFIISDTNMARDLFPDELKFRLNVTNINFNPVTDANIVAALNKIITLEADSLKYSSTKFTVPSKEDLLFIAESSDGDLRSAILKLQFSLCNRNEKSVNSFKIPRAVPQNNSERIKVIKPKSRSKNLKNDRYRICEIDKDKRIDFFSSIGRVLYPKKEFSDSSSGSNDLEKNNYKFVHSPIAIIDNYLTEPNKFVNMLHENYLERFTDIKDVSKAANSLSVSDVLLASFWEAKDTMVQYSLNTAVRSLMISNSKPAQNIFKPMSKSKIWSTENTKKDNLNLVRQIFLDLQSEKDILLDIIPFLSKLKSSINLTEEQDKIISKIAQYK